MAIVGIENTDYRYQAGKAEIGVFDRFRPAPHAHNFLAVGRLCSEWSRSLATVVLALNSTKRLLGASTCPSLSGGCRRYCGHIVEFRAILTPAQPSKRINIWRSIGGPIRKAQIVDVHVALPVHHNSQRYQNGAPKAF